MRRKNEEKDEHSENLTLYSNDQINSKSGRDKNTIKCTKKKIY